MKKIWRILFVTSSLMACNEPGGHDSNATSEPAKEQHDHTEKVPGMVLNSGAKWKADSTTMVNAVNLQTIIAAAKTESPADYLQTSTALQAGLNKMVSECKMQGADHDALHVWLEPLMEKTKELGKTTSTENAATILHELETQVNLFPHYFE